MELLQLRYYQTVARREHMSRAAEELSVSQPSLSKTIRTLENELGVKLFDRKGKYIRLNEAGREFLKHVNHALATLDEGIGAVQSPAYRDRQPVSLVFLAGSPVIPPLLSAFRRLHPEVEFHLQQHIDNSPKPTFDLCLSCLPPEYDNLTTVSLMSEEIFIGVPPGHPLACRKEIALSELAGERFVHLKTNHALRRITDCYCELAGFRPQIVFESDDASTVRSLINAGLGIGFIPALSWNRAMDPGIPLLRVREPACRRSILLSWPDNRNAAPLSLQFREFICDYFRRLQAEQSPHT